MTESHASKAASKVSFNPDKLTERPPVSEAQKATIRRVFNGALAKMAYTNKQRKIWLEGNDE